MAHFAKLNETNNVIAVIVVDDNDCLTESDGIEFLTGWSGGHTNWKQCSYNNNIRKQFPGIGFTYDPTNDVFIAPSPYPSWSLDSNFDWQPPVPQPLDTDTMYLWDEQHLVWRAV